MLTLAPRDYFGMDLLNEMDRNFKQFFRTPLFREEPAQHPMKSDVRKEDGLYLLAMDLPGYEKENIKAELKDGYLTISAEKTENKEEGNQETGYILRERYTGSCSRSFYVGENVKEDDIKAAFKDGTLHLSFPAEPEKQIEAPKQIAIA